MQDHKAQWVKTGCSIMCDGWTDKCGRHLLNFLVNSTKGTMFVESYDVSSFIQDALKMYEFFESFVKKVGIENVVQVVTDSASNNVLAGKFLMNAYPTLYWTPCAAHCLDLMLEDLGKLEKIKKTITRAIRISGYIYTHGRLLSLMREYTGNKNLHRPAKTRFATSFISLSSLHRNKNGLRKVFTSEEWTSSKWSKEPKGKRVEQFVMNVTFWKHIVYCLKVSGPLVKVLRLVDGERKPPMGYIYEAMDKAKEAISKSFNEKQEDYQPIWDIIDRRWNVQLHQPLHAAGHYLNPGIYYARQEGNNDCDRDSMEGLYKCISKFYPREQDQDQITEELPMYKHVDGLFGNSLAKRQRNKKSPAEWWSAYGSSTPNLQEFAVRILSLTCSSSGCERNWSVFEQVYPGQRAAGIEADMMAANELNAHSYLQSFSESEACDNLQILLGGFETSTGEQWLAFRNYGKYSAADYAKNASEKVSRTCAQGEQGSWNPFEQKQTIKRRRFFVLKLLYGAMQGLAYMHDHDRLHQSLGPSSVALNTITEREAAYLIPRLRDLAFSVDIRYSYLTEGPGTLSEALWRRASTAGAFTPMDKRAFGIADDIYEAGLLLAYLAFVPFCEEGIMDGLSLKRLLESTFQLDVEATREYCLADDRLLDAVKFLDLGDGAGWELLQAMLNPDFRKRPIAKAVLNHRFITGAVL